MSRGANRLVGLIGLIGLIGFVGLVGFVGFVGLVGFVEFVGAVHLEHKVSGWTKQVFCFEGEMLDRAAGMEDADEILRSPYRLT